MGGCLKRCLMGSYGPLKSCLVRNDWYSGVPKTLSSEFSQAVFHFLGAGGKMGGTDRQHEENRGGREPRAGTGKHSRHTPSSTSLITDHSHFLHTGMRTTGKRCHQTRHRRSSWYHQSTAALSPGAAFFSPRL